jgi:hypothetical protein
MTNQVARRHHPLGAYRSMTGNDTVRCGAGDPDQYGSRAISNNTMDGPPAIRGWAPSRAGSTAAHARLFDALGRPSGHFALMTDPATARFSPGSSHSPRYLPDVNRALELLPASNSVSTLYMRNTST